jgi:uncharacterized protein (TIGR02246 family)
VRRTFTLATIAFFAGLGVGYWAGSAGFAALLRKNAHASDLVAIEKLHQADVAATLTQDPKSLTALWSDDGINLGFPGAPVVGKKAMQGAYEKFRAENPEFQVLKYAADIKDIQISGEWAIETGYTEAIYKLSAKDNPVDVPRTEGMRLLKRQNDGSWKFALVGLK